MIEIILVVFAVGVMIALRIYLFKVSYNNKIKYYSDPNGLAEEFLAKAK